MREIPSFVYDPNLVLYLPLWKRDGNTFISDDHFGHLATVTGATWGIIGRTFSGTDQYITIPIGAWVTGATSISIIAWVKTSSSIGGSRLIVSREQVGGFALGAGWTANRFTLYIHGGVGPGWLDATGTTAISINTWYHTVGTYNGSNINLYVNGALDAGPISHVGTIGGGAQNVRIGIISNGLTGEWDGLIGEVLIYNRVLSLLEIQRNFLATKWRYV